MKKFLFIFIFLFGCANNQDGINKNFSNLNFNEDLSLEEGNQAKQTITEG